MDYLQQAKEFFKNEGYAIETTGIEIEYAEPQNAVCSLTVSDKHKNGVGVVMGGAIYTLADFAFAVAANVGQPLTVTLEGQITYLNPAKCQKLIAKTVCEKSGSKICIYRVLVTDEKENEVASAKFIGCRTSKK